MKLISVILLFISCHANGNVYYISNTGSDGADGLTTGTAWQTIAKVISSTTNGDTVRFNSGNSWNEKLIVPASNMRFEAYGTGAKPIITGLQTLTGFTNVGNIWTATATNSVPKLNTVLVGGAIRAKGRYPNSTYLTLSSFSGSPINSITGGLTGTPNYTGGEIAVRSSHFTMDVAKITSQSSGTLNFSPALTYSDTYGGRGYFIQNIESVLDVAGEWCYDSTTKVLKVYSTTSPTVQISSIDTLVYLNGKSYVTFDGLSFTGANKAGFQLDTCTHITITNCTITNSGAMGICALKTDYTTISNDSIVNSFSNAMYMRQVDPYTPTVNTCNYTTVNNCYIKNAGNVQGMGMNHQSRYMGIVVIGTETTITNNRLDSIGFVGIFFVGQNSLVKRNYVTNFCFVLDDGAGIYTVIGAYFPADYNDSSVIRSNIVIGGIGASAGTNTTSYAAGIYLDNYSRLITEDSNTVSNCVTASYFFNESNTITFTDNVSVNGYGSGLTVAGSNALIGTASTIKRNILYSSSATKYTLERTYGTSLGTTDSNYYSRPLSESTLLYLNSASYSLAGWKTATGKDANSYGTPSLVTNATPLFYYNPTQSDSTISLSGTYIDSKNGVHDNSVTLSAFTSVVLYTSSYQTRQRSIQSFKFYKGTVL